MKRMMKKMLGLLMTIVICLTSIPVSAYAEKAIVDTMEEESSHQQETGEIAETVKSQGTGSVSLENESNQGKDADVFNKWDGITKENVYEDNGFRVTFRLQDYWSGGFNANVKIENTGDTTIENWTLGFDYQGGIANIWDAVLDSSDQAKYVVKNAGWNQDIAVGKSVEFGISGQGDFVGFPSKYQMRGQINNLGTDDYSIDYALSSDWESGFNANITITNNTDKDLEDWILEFDFDRNITEVWNATIESHKGNHYIIKNAQCNSIILPNNSVSIGFSGYSGNAEDIPVNCTLYSYKYEEVDVNQRDKEPLESIGEAYVKSPTIDDIVVDEDTGIQYVKNQLLISAYMGADKTIFEEIAEEVGAEIVGYIALTNDYQFEFIDDKCLDEIITIADYIDSFSFVSSVSLNIVFSQETELFKSNDEQYNDHQTWYQLDGTAYLDDEVDDEWDEDNPQGDNWWLEALRVPTAWDDKASFSPVKVGVYDEDFDDNHEDLDFDDIINNPASSDIKSHGTHVSGILAARHNNKTGISGIATDTRLYAYAYSGNDYGSSMGDKLAYATLIGNHVKVINVSSGMNAEINFAASHPEISEDYCNKARNYIQTAADILAEYLNKLLTAGYDFVICTSAGNANEAQFVIDTNKTYGIRSLEINTEANQEEKNDPTITKYSGGVLAYYDSALTAITDTALKNRIIVVGSMGRLSIGSYFVSDFSNIGDRVDVIAPGEDILSTVPVAYDPLGYGLMNGTSMASPCVAGLVAMMYQVNPSIKGSLVKTYLRRGSSQSLSDSNYSYPIPDAVESCKYAKNGYIPSSNDNTLPSGIVCGFTKDSDGNAIANVKITANRESTGEYNLDEYNEYSFSFESDSEGYYLQTLPQGTYTFVVSKEGYLPYAIQGIVINPDETTYMENIVLSKWLSIAYLDREVQGTVKDALKGTVINGAAIKLRKGWNNKTGAYVTNILGITKSATTGSDGTFSIDVSIGTYTAEVSKNGYVTGYYNVISGDTGLFSDYAQSTMILTPVLSEDEYRIVLTWGNSPRDLDSHLTYYVDGIRQCHVYYSNKIGTYNGEKIAQLDLDDRFSYGPETITITLDASLVADGGEFKYSVHNYSEKSSSTSSSLSLSNATVRVYAGNDIIKTFNIPKDVAGTVWHVFDITEDGIKSVNEFYNESSTAGVK